MECLNERKIPHIIHQVWSGKYGSLPQKYASWGNTWKEQHPGYAYHIWSEKEMEEFVMLYYPHRVGEYHAFPYDIQRWDLIRYLILYQYGGVYADFDYECLKNIDPLIKDQSCCFAREPASHEKAFHKKQVFNNAFMAAVPQHPFMLQLIEECFVRRQTKKETDNKMSYVLETTGTWMLWEVYASYAFKDSIGLIPAACISPLDKIEARKISRGSKVPQLEERLREAYAVHYFEGKWL